MKIPVIIAAALLSTSAYAAIPNGPPATLVYGPYPGQTYLTCAPAKPSGVAVVLAHGNYANGSASQGNDYEICNQLAAAGIYVMDINYRLAYAAPWPAQLQDMQLAIRYLHAHGYAIVGAAGTSAGGMISLQAGANGTVSETGDTLHEYAMWWRQPVRPAFVIDISGPTDYTMEIDDGTPDGMPAQMKTMTTAQAIAELSVVNYIDCHTAPTIVFQGLSDNHTRTDQAVELVGLLAQNEVPYVYQPYVGGHVFSGVAPATESAFIAQAAAFALAPRTAIYPAACPAK